MTVEATDKGALNRLAGDVIMALRFFSRLPTGRSPHQRPHLGRIAAVLPVTSVIMGVVPGALFLGGVQLGLTPIFAAVLAVATMVLVGGGMMEDALADAADGLFGGSTPDRRLDILKDSRHGTYGVSALCLFLLLRVAFFGTLPLSPLAIFCLWLCANTAGRSAGLWLAVALSPARTDGASAGAGRLGARAYWVGAALAGLFAALFTTWIVGVVGLAVLGMALVVVNLAWAALCRRLVGGQTGDLIGAAGALGEIAALTALMIFV